MDVFYRFITLDGKTIETKMTTDNDWLAHKLNIGSPVTVSYIERKPKKSFIFYKKFFLGGDETEALALMNFDTRRAVEGYLTDKSLQLKNGFLKYETTANLRSSKELVAIIREGINFAGRLVLPSSKIRSRLAENVLADPEQEVRLRNLRALAKSFRNDGETNSTLRSALEDRHPKVRFEAAKLLGDEGYESLKRIVTDFHDDPGIAESALSYMAENFPAEKVLPFLEEIYYRTTDSRRLKALRAIVVISDTSSMGLALNALQVEDDEIRIAAAGLLAVIGTVDSIPALHNAIGGNFSSRTLRRAVNEAVVRIQSRLHGAETGQVALASDEDPGGEVSLFREENGGRLAFEEKED